MNIHVSHILSIIDAQVVGKNLFDHQITEVVYDTRKITMPDEALFVALKGEIRDGHQFIDSAYSLGIKVFLIDLDTPIDIGNYPEACFLRVISPLVSLQKIAQKHRSQFRIPVIGITGSNGKTVVKEWLNELLSPDFKIHRSPRSFNSQLGVAVSLLGIQKGHQLSLIEAGISEKSEMNALWDMIKPSLTVITHLGSQHNAGFDSMREKAIEKLKLCEGADVVVFPRDIEALEKGIAEWKKKQPLTKFISWGHSEGATFRILKIEKVDHSQVITFYYRGAEHLIEIPFLDDASVSNAMTCFCVLFALERWDKEHVQRFLSLRSVHNRLTIEKGRRGNVILNDSYSNDFESLAIAIDVIQRQQPNLPLMIVLSEMDNKEISDEHHIKVVNLLKQKSVKNLIFLGKMQPDFGSEMQVQYYTTTEELLKSEVLNSIVATAILVKGARKYQLESVVEVLKERLHKTSLEINLEAIKHNFRFFRKSIASETKLMCMVKAFGYGSGTFEVSKTLQEMNVDYLGVAFADEGVALREAGIEVPIMVMNTDAQTMDILHQFNLEPVVYSLSNLQSYISCLEGRNGSIHLELDTGMHRLGFAPSELLHAVDSIPKNIKVKSIFSHLAVSENPEFDDFTRNQARVFFEFAGKTESILGYSVLKHISNTGGIERFPEIQGNMVRLGIGLYGLQPDGTEIKELQTVASLFSTVTQIHDVQANEGIGYGLHDHEPYKRRIATIAMGYADGLSRRYGKKVGSVMINGNEVPFVGNICMDMAMVDVTDIQCNEGDRVEIFGEQLSINKMARRGGTISYEILTGISQRVPRIYLGDN